MSDEMRVFGIGSPFADDRLGWLVVDLLHARGMSSAVAIHNLSDLFEYFPGCRRAVIVDSCLGTAPVGTIHRYVWPEICTVQRTRGTTHGFDLSSTLRLAESLGMLPQSVVIYAVELQSCHPSLATSDAVLAAGRRVAERIELEVILTASEN